LVEQLAVVPLSWQVTQAGQLLPAPLQALPSLEHVPLMATSPLQMPQARNAVEH
jgi:hypothetical protein